jgi:hypothetical protein
VAQTTRILALALVGADILLIIMLGALIFVRSRGLFVPLTKFVDGSRRSRRQPTLASGCRSPRMTTKSPVRGDPQRDARALGVGLEESKGLRR